MKTSNGSQLLSLSRKMMVAFVMLGIACIFAFGCSDDDNPTATTQFENSTEISFVNINAHESLEVISISHGCMGSYWYSCKFSGTTPMRVEIFESPSNGFNGDTLYVGTAELSETNRQHLDNMLDVYRNLTDSIYCTLVSGIHISLCSGPTVTIAEEYTDGTCEVHAAEDVLTFGRLKHCVREGLPITNLD